MSRIERKIKNFNSDGNVDVVNYDIETIKRMVGNSYKSIKTSRF